MASEMSKPNYGRTGWSVPGWFAVLCVSLGMGWVGWVSVQTIHNTQQLGLGERFTRGDGIEFDLRLKALESNQCPQPWMEKKVDRFGSESERNRDLINNILRNQAPGRHDNNNL